MTIKNKEGRGAQAAAENKAFLRRGRIAWSLGAVMLLIGLAPLAFMAWKQTQFNRVALSTAQQEYQLLLAESIAHGIDIHVDGLSAELLRVSQTLGGTIRRTGGSSADLRRDLAEVVDERMPYLRYDDARSGARSVAAGDLASEIERAFDGTIEEATALLSDASGRRPGKTIVSQPMLAGAPPRARLVISAPVLSSGELRGVLSSFIDLEHVWAAVVNRRSGHAIFGADTTGRVFTNNSSSGPRPGKIAAESALVQRFLESSQFGRATVTFEDTVDGETQEFQGSFEITGQGWGVFIQAPSQDVYRPIEAMVESTWNTAVLVLVLCVALSWFFARTLSHPINRLAGASSRFAAGDLSTRVSVRTRNEIGELAHSFNVMADEIEDQIRKLKRAARENHELFMGTIRAMAQAIDAKDPYTRGHSMRVNKYSVILAKELGLRGAQLREIHVSSLMHDVGKIGIHDEILQKPGKLSDEEFEVMKTHTILGANILAPIRQMKRIIPGLRWHHERMNGRGYPDGLTGDQIPLMARIIAVADTFDAVTTDRPYQKTMTYDEALQVLERLKGDALDPKIVEAFMNAYRRGLIRKETDDAAVPEEALEPVEA